MTGVAARRVPGAGALGSALRVLRPALLGGLLCVPTLAAPVHAVQVVATPILAAPAAEASPRALPVTAAPIAPDAPTLVVRAHTYALTAGEPLVLELTIGDEHRAAVAPLLTSGTGQPTGTSAGTLIGQRVDEPTDTSADTPIDGPAGALRLVVLPSVDTRAALDAALDVPPADGTELDHTVVISGDEVIAGSSTESGIELTVAVTLDVEPGVHPISVAIGETTVRSVIRVLDPDAPTDTITAALLVAVDDPGPFATGAAAAATRTAVRQVVALAAQFDDPLTVVLPVAAARLADDADTDSTARGDTETAHADNNTAADSNNDDNTATAGADNAGGLLAGELADDTLLARSANGIDPSAAVQRNADELFTTDLRDGEDELARRMPLAAVRRNVWWVDGELSRPAAEHLRLIGVRMLLFAPGHAPGGARQPTPFVVDLGDGERMSAIEATGFDSAGRLHLPDGASTDATDAAASTSAATNTSADTDATGTEPGTRTSTDVATNDTNDIATNDTGTNDTSDAGPAVAAARLLAGVELYAAEHGTVALVLTPIDGALPTAELLAAIAADAAQHGGIDIAPTTVVANIAERATRTADVAVAALPDLAGADLAARLWSIGTVRPRVDQARSMLVEPDVGSDWDARLTATLSANASDADAAAALAAVEQEVGAILGALVPPEAVPFTLTGTDTPLYFTVGNTSDTPLRAAVKIRSSKLEMRKLPEERIVPPGGTETFDVPVKVRSNGTFTVVVDVLSPDGNVVASTSNIKATVSRLGGLGQLVSGGLVLVLASWWYSHFRRRARNAAAAAAHDGGEPQHGAPQHG